MSEYSSIPDLYGARQTSLATVGALGGKLLLWHLNDLIVDLVDLDMDGCLHDAPDNDISEEVEPIVAEDAC